MNSKSAATWRRGLLALLVLGALVWFAGWGLPEVCAQQLPTDSTTPVEVCKAMSASDPRALLFLLLLGGLLLPELTELEVAGVLTVRRQVREAKEEVSGMKTELAHIRTEILTAATAAAHSQSRASVENYNVFPERAADVRRAYEEAAGNGDGEFDESEERGAYAAVAFEAGFDGLTRYLSAGMTPAVVAGYRFNADDELELDLLTTRGDVPTDLQDALLAAESPRTSGVFYDDSINGYMLSAPACDDQSLVVGALVVLMPASAASLDTADDEDTIGTVVMMANAYARLLIDVMGEKPRQVPAGKKTSEGTQ